MMMLLVFSLLGNLVDITHTDTIYYIALLFFYLKRGFGAGMSVAYVEKGHGSSVFATHICIPFGPHTRSICSSVLW